MNSKKTNREIWQEELASRLPEFGCSNPAEENIPFTMESMIFNDGYGTITVTGGEELTIGNHDFTLTFDPNDANLDASRYNLDTCHNTAPFSQSMYDDQEWFHFLGEQMTITSSLDPIPGVDLTFDISEYSQGTSYNFWDIDGVEQDPQYQIDLDSIVEWLKNPNNL